MKLSRARLKQIVTEEIRRMDEVSNEEVQIATMQAMAQGEAVNNSSDPEIIQQIQKRTPQSHTNRMKNQPTHVFDFKSTLTSNIEPK